MTNRKILELILNTSGFTIENFEYIRDNSMVGYEFEAHQNGIFQFDVATDSFNDAVRATLEGIYGTDNVKFHRI